MKRLLPLLAALAVVVAAGLVHGLWTDRWGRSQALAEAAARLGRLPGDAGDWRASPHELDAASLERAGVVAWWARSYRQRGTGASASVILLCGRAGHMSVHRPENCYQAAGYEMTGPAARWSPSPGEGPPGAEFWTATFQRQQPTGLVQLRIYWAWYADGRWQAADSPRLAFARLPALYKLYVVRETGLNERPEDDPCRDLLRRLLPELEKALSPPAPAPPSG